MKHQDLSVEDSLREDQSKQPNRNVQKTLVNIQMANTKTEQEKIDISLNNINSDDESNVVKQNSPQTLKVEKSSVHDIKKSMSIREKIVAKKLASKRSEDDDVRMLSSLTIEDVDNSKKAKK